MGQQARQFGGKLRILFCRLISLFQRQDQRHQGLGDKAPAIGAEMAACIRPRTERIGNLVHAFCLLKWCGFFAAIIKSRMRAASFTPGALSTPEETSTSFAPERAIARATLSEPRPSAKYHGLVKLLPPRIFQSMAWPWPPPHTTPKGKQATNNSKTATFS